MTTAKKPVAPPAPPAPKGKSGKTTITNKKSSKGQLSGTLTPKPTKNDPNSFADSTYWDTLNSLIRDSDLYKQNMGLQQARTNEDYGVTTQKLAKQRGRDLDSIRNDFAARGIVKSSPYGTRVGQYEDDYQTSLADLARAKNRSLQDISMGYQQYLEQWRLQKQQAIQDAIQRKLAKLKK